MQTTYTIIERSKKEACQIWKSRCKTQNPKSPLRYRPVIVIGPNEGYINCELGYAEQNEWEVVSHFTTAGWCNDLGIH